MKERIEEKLNENFEKILLKEELTYEDVVILKEKLNEIKLDENKEETDLRKKELVELMSKTIF